MENGRAEPSGFLCFLQERFRQGDLAKIVDPSFPAVLNVTLCLHVHAHTEVAKAQALEADKATTESTETTVAPSPYPLPAEFSEARR